MAKAVKAEKNDKQRIVTPEFRVSYPHVFKAAQVQGKGDPKYSITMLFKKTQDLKAIKQAIRQAKITAFGPNEEDWPDDLASPVTDGDKAKYADKEGYKGHWAIKATSNQDSKPGVVDENVEPITDPSVFYPGCYARAQVFARVWEYMGKRGIHFILDHVQKTRDGKSFGGKKAANEVFAPIVSEESDEDVDTDAEDNQEGAQAGFR